MKRYTIKPCELPSGFYWFFKGKQEAVVVEKRDGEDYVRFTSGGRRSWIADDESFIGPLPTPSMEELQQAAISAI